VTTSGPELRNRGTASQPKFIQSVRGPPSVRACPSVAPTRNHREHGRAARRSSTGSRRGTQHGRVLAHARRSPSLHGDQIKIHLANAGTVDDHRRSAAAMPVARKWLTEPPFFCRNEDRLHHRCRRIVVGEGEVDEVVSAGVAASASLKRTAPRARWHAGDRRLLRSPRPSQHRRQRCVGDAPKGELPKDFAGAR